ncbi:MAG: hypothetical protein WA012_11910 [Rhodoferax sp.]
MPSDGMDCRALACPEFIEGLAVTGDLHIPPVLPTHLEHVLVVDCSKHQTITLD